MKWIFIDLVQVPKVGDKLFSYLQLLTGSFIHFIFQFFRVHFPLFFVICVCVCVCVNGKSCP